MKRPFPYPAFAVSVFALTVFALPAAWAHGVDIADVTGTLPLRTLRFAYSTGEPMEFARVKVYAPSRPEDAAQESVADKNGLFSFYPDEDGGWKLTCEDGMGHKGEIIVTVDKVSARAEGIAAADASSARPLNGALPRWAGIVMGLSLIANVFSLWYFAGSKRGKGRAH